MKKLALFDLDGTLFDTNDVNYHAYLNAVKKWGYSIDYDFYRRECNGRHYKYFLPLIGITEEFMQEDIHRAKKENYFRYLQYAKMNIHLFHFIDMMSDEYYRAIVTTASRKNVEDILKFFDKENCFDLLITQEDISRQKPDPEGFFLAMRYFDISEKDTIIFEDSDVGIQAARATGASVMIVDVF